MANNDDWEDIGPKTKGAATKQSSGDWEDITPSAKATSEPTQFEKDRTPDESGGFLAGVKQSLSSIPSGVDLLTAGMPGVGAARALYNTAVNAPQHMRDEWNADKGMNPIVRIAGAGAAALSPLVGIDPDAMRATAEHGDTAGVLGQAALPTGLALSPLAAEGIAKTATAVRTAALGNPDVAALKGLQVGARSPKAIKALRDVEGARPYLKGATSQADLQARIPAAKTEIWQPYEDAINQVGHRTVNGPDGPATVADLESERLKVSAQLRAARDMKPSDLQTVMQKDQAVAELTRRDTAIKSAIDPELQTTGIDPQKIRNTFGSVKGIEGKVSGKSTLAEPSKPTGFGRVTGIRLTKPSTWLGEPLQGARDLVAGRPLWRAKPTDLKIREGFAVGGDKPNLTPFTPSTSFSSLRGLLGSGAIPSPPVSTPAGPPSFSAAEGTRASRLGLLLPEHASPTLQMPASSGIEPGPSSTPLRTVVRDPKTGRMKRMYLSGSQPLAGEP